MKKLIRVSWISLFLSGLLLITVILTSQKQVFSDELGDPRPIDIVLSGENIPRLPYIGKTEPIKPLRTDVVSWSDLVFQSVRDGNWEIYFAHGNGSGLRRLTHSPSSDIQPHLNRGATKVVFASNRFGSYEIFSMNVDGTNLIRLTTNGADDVKPVWSPDGDKILFQSYRDGQSEIYKMNADGTGKTRLTINGVYDGRGNWSPDGQKITYISQQNGQYRVWVMNADGSGKVRLSNQPYSANPIWSPDGEKIAYDADQDGEGRQELWLMNADGTNQQLLYDWGGTSTDTWAGSWSPDGNEIAFTQIELVYYEGDWYWTSAQIKTLNLSEMLVWQLSYGDKDWYPALQTVDNQVPISTMSSLPTYSRTSALIEWLSHDVGESGLKYFDLQYRESNSSTWQDWLQTYTNTSAKFTNSLGQSYHFRVRATDNAYNTEQWLSPNEESHTTLYSWGIQGEIKDNTGVPIVGANTVVSPAAFYVTESNDDGQFLSLNAVETNSYDVSWEKNLYGPLPVTIFDSKIDSTIEVVLPPIDDVVLNGGFEDSPTNLKNWVVSGTLTTTLLNENQHSGIQSVKMGRDCPQPCLGAEEYVEGSPEFVVDSNGVVHVIFGGVSYRFRTPDGVWSEPLLIHSSHYTYGTQPKLAIDGDDTLHAVWNDNDGIHYSQKPIAGIWTKPEVLVQGRVHAIGVDSNGNTYISYRADDPNTGTWSLYSRERTSLGVWCSPNVLDPDGYIGSDIAIGLDDTVHYIWQANDNIYHRSKTDDGKWSITSILHNEGSYYKQRIVADLSGGLHAYWSDYSSGYYIHRPPHGEWSPVTLLPNSSGEGSLTTDWEGNVYLVNNNNEPGGAYYRTKSTSGVWTDPVLIDDWGGATPSIIVDSFNIMHLAYIDSDVPEYIRYQTRQIASSSGSGSISQQIIIPEEAHLPHISLFYQGDGMVADSNSVLSIFVESDGNQTSLLSLNEGGLWKHVWASLAPWSGQTITLTIQLFQEENSVIRSVLLDEISVGSSYPDLWVKYGPLPSSVIPEDRVVYQVQFGNRSRALTAEETELQMVLDEDFEYLSAYPVPLIDGTNLTWEFGSLAPDFMGGTIVVTGTVSAESEYFSTLDNYIEIDAETPELETLNNTQNSQIHIVHSLYLPIISQNTP